MVAYKLTLGSEGDGLGPWSNRRFWVGRSTTAYQQH